MPGKAGSCSWPPDPKEEEACPCQCGAAQCIQQAGKDVLHLEMSPSLLFRPPLSPVSFPACPALFPIKDFTALLISCHLGRPNDRYVQAFLMRHKTGDAFGLAACCLSCLLPRPPHSIPCDTACGPPLLCCGRSPEDKLVPLPQTVG